MAEKLNPDVEELISYNRAACKHEKMETTTRWRGGIEGRIGGSRPVRVWYCDECKRDVRDWDMFQDDPATKLFMESLKKGKINALEVKSGTQLSFPNFEKNKVVSDSAVDFSTWRVPLT